MAVGTEISQSTQNILNAFDDFLSSTDKQQSIFTAILKDYNSTNTSKSWFQRNFNISFGSAVKVVGLFASKPRSTLSLIKFYRNKDQYNTKEFQQELLKKDSIRSFLKQGATNITNFGAMMDSLQIKLFDSGQLLDSQSLDKLQHAFSNDENIKQLQSIAIQSVSDRPDSLKITSDLLKMMSNSQDFQHFFAKKSGKIQEYISQSLRDKIDLEAKDQQKWQKLINSKPEPSNKQKSKFLNKLGLQKQEIKTAIDSGKLPDSFAETIKSYGLKIEDIDQMLSIIPPLLNSPRELQIIVDYMARGDYADMAKKVLDLATTKPEIQAYLTKNNKIFNKIATASVDFKKYGVNNDVGKILDHLTTQDNLSDIKKISQLAGDQKWNEVVKNLCLLLEKPEFAEYVVNNNSDIAKLLDIALEKMPNARQYISGVDTKLLTSVILQNPSSVRKLFESFDHGAKEISSALTSFIATNPKILGVAYQAVTNKYYYGKNVEEQKTINLIMDSLITTDKSTKSIDLTSLLTKTVKQLPEAKLPKDNQNQALQQIAKYNFFDGATIEGGNNKQINFQNLEINNAQFVNTIFKNVSFAGSDLTNVSFHGASLTNVDFNNATIDGTTLESLLPIASANNIALSNVKIVGELANSLDLSKTNLKGVDLSKVTSMENMNLSNVDFTNAIMPDDKELFIKSFNLSQAKFPDGFDTSQIIQANKQWIEQQVADKIVYKYKRDDSLTNEQEESIRIKISAIYKDQGIIGQEFRETINNDPASFMSAAFSKNQAKIGNKFSHITEYSKTRKQISHKLSVILDNVNTPEKTEQIFVAELMADQVSTKLFQQGKNRGKDAAMINDLIVDVVQNLGEDNKVVAKEILEHKNYQNIVNSVSNIIAQKLRSTKVGVLTGGVYLPEENIDAILEKKIKSSIENAINTSSEIKLNDKEMSELASMSKDVVHNLFGSTDSELQTNNQSMVMNSLKTVFAELKSDHNIDFAPIIKAHKGELLGKIDKGHFYSTANGLTKLYYDNTHYTSNSISDSVKREGFLSQLKEEIIKTTQDSIAQAKIAGDHSQHTGKYEHAITNKDKVRAAKIGSHIKNVARKPSVPPIKTNNQRAR